MSLAANLQAFAQRVATEFKAVRAEMAALPTGGASISDSTTTTTTVWSSSKTSTQLGGKVDSGDARLSDARTPLAHTQAASTISDSTTVGRSVLTAVDATAVRTAIGAGTSSLALGTTSTTAKAGNYTGGPITGSWDGEWTLSGTGLSTASGSTTTTTWATEVTASSVITRAANNQDFTVSTAGLYAISATVRMMAVGAGQAYIAISVNGNVLIQNGMVQNGGTATAFASLTRKFAATDIIRVVVFQNGGTTVNAETAAANLSRLVIARVY